MFSGFSILKCFNIDDKIDKITTLRKIMFLFLFFTISVKTPDEKNRITHFVTVPSYFWETKDNNQGRNIIKF